MKNLRIVSLIIPFVTALVVFGLTVILLAPQLKEIGQFRNMNKGYLETLSLLTTKSLQLEAIEKNEQKYRAEKVISVLPAEQDVPNALVVSRELANETGLVIKKMTVESSNVASPLPFFLISVTAETELDKIMPFLERVETTSPLLGFERISFSSLGQNLFEISYTLKNYFLDYPKDIGTPETSLPQITAQEEDIYQSNVQNLKPLAGLEAILPSEGSGQMGKLNPFIP
jgi:Tfp pilus assembly protein PilO